MEVNTIGWIRVGRPKVHWIHTVLETAWNEFRHSYPEEIQGYDNLYSQKEIIKQTADNRTYPFHTKPKSTYAQRQKRIRKHKEKRRIQILRREAGEAQ